MALSTDAEVTGVHDVRIDPGLAAIIHATELDRPAPAWINVLIGNWLVQGRPVSSRTFVHATRESLFTSVWNTPDARRLRGSDAEKRRIVLDSLQPTMGVIEQSASIPAPVLHLVEVTIVTATGPSIHPPVFRAKASSVDGWWVNDFEVKQPKGGGTTVGAGISF